MRSLKITVFILLVSCNNIQKEQDDLFIQYKKSLLRRASYKSGVDTVYYSNGNVFGIFEHEFRMVNGKVRWYNEDGSLEHISYILKNDLYIIGTDFDNESKPKMYFYNLPSNENDQFCVNYKSNLKEVIINCDKVFGTNKFEYINDSSALIPVPCPPLGLKKIFIELSEKEKYTSVEYIVDSIYFGYGVLIPFDFISKVDNSYKISYIWIYEGDTILKKQNNFIGYESILPNGF